MQDIFVVQVAFNYSIGVPLCSTVVTRPMLQQDSHMKHSKFRVWAIDFTAEQLKLKNSVQYTKCLFNFIKSYVYNQPVSHCCLPMAVALYPVGFILQVKFHPLTHRLDFSVVDTRNQSFKQTFQSFSVIGFFKANISPHVYKIN